ncbi:alkylhydroperoxidase [Amycolatopsis sp. WAC 01376]|uniref:carboxymuconolactone decarboxylase family protein n=1 Tax=Amycolatopsis sp. WAC 01376 TaxID=2203195 RepID=UPI000F76BBE9|nr:carboxymuconolactone decarboxylase family protein [Amycolatopsis sp. WAC 01376]RSM60413.1 alkylhydroperoxidase [Amycolatopsis sp. WAC 01376]
MAPALVRLALRRVLREVRYVRPVPYGRATGLVRDVYRRLEREFGMLAPPVALHSPSPTVLAASWVMLRESLVAAGVTSRADREVVATLVSRANSCPYCVEVHGMTLDSLGRSSEASATAEGRPVADPFAGALSVAARAELTAVAFTFHYLNRVVSVFLGPSPLPPNVPDSARSKAKAVLGRLLRPASAALPGESLDLLPAGSRDFSWAAGNPIMEDAFSRAASAFASLAVPSAVRDVVARELSTWDGSAPGLSRSWVDAFDDPAVRLALVVAKAPYQVDDALVTAAGLGDRELVELVGWTSFAAAAHRVSLSGSPSTT